MIFEDNKHVLLFIKNKTGETAVTHMIFFIAAILIAMLVITVMSSNVQSLTSATSSSSRLLSDHIKTDITIVNDPQMIPYDALTKRYVFYIKNTGRKELDVNYVDIFLDGRYIEKKNVVISMLDQNALWQPSDLIVIEIVVDSELSSGDHRLHIATNSGKSDSMDFKI